MNTKNTNAKNNTAKRNAGSVPAWDEIEQADTGKAARIERWRGHAAKIVPTYRTPALDALANAANLSPVEYVIAYLSATRGMNGGGAEELYHRTTDVELEAMHTRTRNHEECETVRAAAFALSCPDAADNFTARELQTLAVRFMRKGEWTFDAAIVRAAKAGLASGNA